MRQLIVSLIFLAAACKGGKSQPSPQRPDATPGAAAPPTALVVPTVEVASVLATVEGAPPHLVLLEDSGQVRVAAAESWAELDAGRLQLARRAMPLARADVYVRESFALGKAPRDTLATLDQASDSDLVADDLAALDEVPSAADLADDPPPPDDGADESGGTGTAMALEEGLMGPGGADDADEQAKQPRDPSAPPPPGKPQRTSLSVRRRGAPADAKATAGSLPERVATAEGLVVEDGKLDPLRAMLFVAKTAKATKLIDAVSETSMAIAVAHAGKIRPLRLQFAHRDGPLLDAEHWLEVRVSAKRLVIEAVPDAPIELASFDAKALAAAVEQARVTRGAEAHAPVDVLVDADLDAQRLIDVAVALDTAGVRLIGMEPAPSAEELAQRGKRIPRAALGVASITGDLDKAAIRQVLKANLPKVETCYSAALAAKPQLAGVVTARFTISGKGKVASSTASGVDPALATCVANVLKPLEFPRGKKASGVVSVTYPFILRQ